MATPGLNKAELASSPRSPGSPGSQGSQGSGSESGSGSPEEASDATPELQLVNKKPRLGLNKTDRCFKLSRTTLVVLNFYLLGLGVAFLAGGVVIVQMEDTWRPLVDDSYHESLTSGLKDADVNIDTSKFSLVGFVTPIAHWLLGAGTVLGLVALLGCYGSIPKIRTSLVLYCGALIVLLVVQCVLVYHMYEQRTIFDKTVKSTVKASLNDFSGIEGSDTNTLAWNAIMKRWGCCGVDSYTDFKGLPKWPPETIGNMTVYNLETPIMCCKGSTNFTMTGMFTCAMKFEACGDNNNMHTGCYDIMFDQIVHHYIVKFVVLISIAFQSMLVISSGSLVLIVSKVRDPAELEVDKILNTPTTPADPPEKIRQQSSDGSDFESELISAIYEGDSGSTARSTYGSSSNATSPTSSKTGSLLLEPGSLPSSRRQS